VPGRFINDTSDVFIHIASSDKERMQTNLKTHINYIANSGCVPVIRLAKLWAFRNNISIKTFILELFVVDVLSGSRTKDNLQESFLSVLEAFQDQFETTQLVDPANTNNIVSRTIELSDKRNVSSAAREAFSKVDGTSRLDNWREIFKDSGQPKPFNINHGIAESASVGFTPRAPWGN
jgi:hypothetical protein